MTDENIGSAAFTPATGMVDHLNSRGFGPTADEIAMVRAYLAPGEMDPAPLLRLAEQATAREQRGAERKARDWPALGQYREANAALASQPVDVVFIGDSITEIWGLAQPDLFTGGVVNRGISGQTSPQILLRFMADVVGLKPRAVHLMCGTNDIAGNTGPNTVQDYKNNILAMLTLAEANGIRIILGSLTPVSAAWKPSVADPAARIAKLNAWLADLAVERRLIRADYFPVLSNADGELRADFHRDGLHPGAAGYAAMRPVTDAAIAIALRG
jgi:lysophospholipase L1-like esterase